MGPRVAEIWVSTGEAGNRLRWESTKGVQIVREAEGISFQGPGEDEMKEQLDPKVYLPRGPRHLHPDQNRTSLYGP
jgi:hypothetical protein